MSMISSDWRETLKTTLTEELSTVRSCGWSGSADENVHSSSVAAGCACAGACADGGCCCCCCGGAGDELSPRRFAPPEDDIGGAGEADLRDCWNWKGEAVRGVVDSDAKGSDDAGDSCWACC